MARANKRKWLRLVRQASRKAHLVKEHGFSNDMLAKDESAKQFVIFGEIRRGRRPFESFKPKTQQSLL